MKKVSTRNRKQSYPQHEVRRHVKQIKKEMSNHSKSDLIEFADLRTGQVKLQDTLSTLQAEVSLNTELTKQMHDILAGFRIVATVAKWLTAVGSAVAVAYHGFIWVKGLK